MNMLKHYMERMWNFVQLPEMVYHEEGYFILKFITQSYNEEVLMKGPYTLRNMPILLCDWRPGFSLKEDMLRTLPIWVKLPLLPLHIWGFKSLNKIGSALGNPLLTDECTASKARVSYARILVEVDVTQELRNCINIKDVEGRILIQPVEYEWKPFFCGKGQMFGHNCKEKVLKKWQPMIPLPEGKQDPVLVVEETPKPATNEAIKPVEVRLEDIGKEWETVLNGRDRGKRSIQEQVVTNCWNGYEEAVRDNWNVPLTGRAMYVVWEKLKRLKPLMRKLNKLLTTLKQDIVKSRDELACAHHDVNDDPLDKCKVQRMQECTEKVIALNELEEKILKQRSKIEWLKLGDGNNSYFHATIKAKHTAKGMHILHKDDGTVITNQNEIEQTLVDFYKGLMGTAARDIIQVDISALREGPQLTFEQRQRLVGPISEEEVTQALKGIGDLKSPGVDGFGAKFHRASWQIIKQDVMNAVRDFFDKGDLYKAVNCTSVTLIPKSAKARTIKDYRPIVGCTTLYKIISRILTCRLAKVIGSIVIHNQAAFVPGQQIHNHILLTYELLRGYSTKGGVPRCMIQLDLQKAYDMVDWGALELIMKELGLPNLFINWIMLTVKSVSYRFNLNGLYTSHIQEKRGIRQGDPLSPILFVFMMAYFHRLLHKMQKNPDFKHHHKCKELQLTNITFADDVLMFARADTQSVRMLLQVIQDFSCSTRMVVNPRKCKVYIGGADADTCLRIKDLTTFQEGTLPFKYMGIPMSSKRLEIHQFCPLIDRITSRITHWSSRLLSYAGKVQLVKNPLCGLVVLLLVKKIPVAWKDICKPRKCGGLNIIDLKIWNNLAMLRLLWNISKKKDTICVKWMNCYYLKGRDIMQIEERSQYSWVFKAILRQRQVTAEVHNWSSMGQFRTKQVYKQLRATEIQVSWYKMFCGNSARPRALLTLWLACHEKMATRSRLHRFGFVDYVQFSFCLQEETQHHLFFECNETKVIWQLVLKWLGIDRTPQNWAFEIQWMIQMCNGKSTKASVLKMAIAEVVYGLWHYRNAVSFGQVVDSKSVLLSILDMIVYRGWTNPGLRSYMAILML
ncbi:uncharacterized protein LOC131629159 [Vicia villosa]|uniref:uncharacterized protein LOC131629159 n=1 Tax=Vicia villosa TaxID=3911 RepID=UPI00273AF181|nr:uncharacterized protein LOC131629159 [Vicia villosa]